MGFKLGMVGIAALLFSVASVEAANTPSSQIGPRLGITDNFGDPALPWWNHRFPPGYFIDENDDSLEKFVDQTIPYKIQVSELEWIVPSAKLPVRVQPANNNLAIAFYQGRLFLAWRSAPNHFASARTELHIVSSPDYGKTWQLEKTIFAGTDMREPYFVSFKGRLFFFYYEAGTNWTKFEPKDLFRMARNGFGEWTTPEIWGERGEIHWEMKVRRGRVWMTSYKGNHYSTGESTVNLHFKVSDDGWNWQHANPNRPVLYQGGVSEAAFEFDGIGGLWAVTRNEDGDSTGFGSHVAVAAPNNPSGWVFPQKSDRNRYDSPRMFRHGPDLFLIARRDIGGPFDMGLNFLPFSLRKMIFWAAYSFRPKRTTLYWIDQRNKKVVPIYDFPSTGDTSFPSILRTGPHSFLVANYTSPIDKPNQTWFWGQVAEAGTQIYFQELHFSPR